MSLLELVLFGAACYLFGLVSGAVVIPWTGDYSRIAGTTAADDLAIGSSQRAGWVWPRRAT